MVTTIQGNNTSAAVDNNNSIGIPCLRVNQTTSSCSGGADQFVASSDQSGVAVSELPQTSLNGIISTICNIGSSLCELGSVFSPVVSFVKNLFSGTQSNEQIVEGFNSLLHEAGQRSEGLLSSESRTALAELTSVVEELQEDNSNVNLGDIIARWRETRDAQHLLQIAERLESGGCESLNAEEVRELRNSFISGLRTLTRAIRDAESRDATQALEHLHSAADSLVSGVERAHEACQRENPRLTWDDRTFMRERLQESCDYIHHGMEDGSFDLLEHSICDELSSWADCILDYIVRTEEEEEREREEEERRDECEERCRQESLREYLHVLHKRAEQKKLFYRSLMRRAEQDLAIERARARSQEIRTNRLLFEMLNNHGRVQAAESLSRLYAGQELGLIIDEAIISESMLPASVCDIPVFSGIGSSIDLCC